MGHLSRRKFAVSMGALATALPLGASAFDFIPSAGKGFNFLILGDIHFDKLDHHDMAYVREKYPNDIRQIENYSRITRDNLPLLMRAVKESSRKLKPDFFLQLGDFVEGLCGSESLARKQTQEFISLIAAQNLRRPFFVVKGNHDITGAGAKEVYRDDVLDWQGKQLKKSLSTANATFVHKDVRFVIFDCYSADESLEWLKATLQQHKESLLIFSTHQPLVPYNARSNWHVFARPGQEKKREELLDLLGEHNAICLTAHLHKTSILSRVTSKGKFVQVAIGSVIDSPDSRIRHHLIGLDAYTEKLLDLEPDFSPATYEERRQNIEREKQYIRHFEYADFCGYATMTISEDREVRMSIYANADTTPWSVIDITALLKRNVVSTK